MRSRDSYNTGLTPGHVYDTQETNLALWGKTSLRGGNHIGIAL
jgi:hypothetical protein